MTVKERLKKYIDSLGLTISGFEKSIEVTNGYVNSISKSVGVDKIEKILEIYPNLNIEWLLIGKGEMFRNDVDDRLAEIKKLSPEDQERILTTIDALIRDVKNRKSE